MLVIDRPNEAVVCVTMDLYTAPNVYTSLVSYTQLVAHFVPCWLTLCALFSELPKPQRFYQMVLRRVLG